MRTSTLLILLTLAPACIGTPEDPEAVEDPTIATQTEALDLTDPCVYWHANPFFWGIVAGAQAAKDAGITHTFSDCTLKVKDSNAGGFGSESGPICACKEVYGEIAPPQLDHISVDDSGHIQYAVKHQTPGDHFNIQFGIVDSGGLGQMENYSGTFDIPLLNTPPAPAGSLWQFQAEDCNSGIFGDTCNNSWNGYSYVYVPARGTTWMPDNNGPDAVAATYDGGWEQRTRFLTNRTSYWTFKVCTVHFNGGQHVGKYYAGACHIGWGGAEYALQNSQVLKTVANGTGWTWTGNGVVPEGALAGGFEGGKQQFICRAWLDRTGGGNIGYRSLGYHVGKTFGDGCNVAFDGQELHITASYQVLTN